MFSLVIKHHVIVPYFIHLQIMVVRRVSVATIFLSVEIKVAILKVASVEWDL